MNTSFIKNTSWLVSGQIIQMILSLVIGMISARYLGPSNYGALNYVTAIVSIFEPITMLGLYAIVVNELVTKVEKSGEIIGSAICLRLFVGLISSLLVIVIIKVLHPHDDVLFIIALLLSLSLIFRAFDIFNYWYQSQLKSKYTASISLFAYIIVSGYKIYLLITKKNIQWFAFATSLNFLIIAALYFTIYKISNGSNLRFSINTSKNLLSRSYHIIISTIFSSIYLHIDKIILGNTLDAKAVGLYTAAVTVSNIWIIIPGALIDSSRPIIMRLKEEDNRLYLKRLRQISAVIIWLGLLVAIFINIFAKNIIHLLYGSDYIQAVSTLKIYSWAAIFPFLNSIRTIWFICEDKIRFEKLLSLFGLLISPLISYILIIEYGIEGAALSVIFSRMLLTIIIPLLITETKEIVLIYKDAILLKDIISKGDKENIFNILRSRFIKK